MLNAKPIVETTRSQLGLGVNAGIATPPVYVPPENLTEAGLCDWMANALVGQSIQYHEGFLILDRSDSSSEMAAKDRGRLHALAEPGHAAVAFFDRFAGVLSVGNEGWGSRSYREARS